MSPNGEPILSIITVTWNNLKGLEKTAHSINHQTVRNQIQWVVIDGNSSDGSQDFVKKQIRPGDVFVSEKDKGLYDAMNKGIKHAKGEFLWFLNAGDTIYADNIVELLKPFMQRNGVIYGETMLVEPNGKKLGTRSELTTRKLPQTLSKKSLLGGMIVNHQSVIVKKRICPSFNLTWKIAADYDWLCKVLSNNTSVKNSWLIHSCFETGGLSSQKVKSSWKERFLIMKKHFGLFQTLLAHFKIVLRAIVK